MTTDSKVTTEADEPVKTSWQYWKLVWRTGREIEGSDWVKKTLSDMFVLGIVLLSIWLMLGYEDFKSRWLNTLATLIGFVVLAIRRLFWSVTQAPFQIYAKQCEALNELSESTSKQIASLSSELSDVKSANNRKPLQKIEIQHLLESFAKWLERERNNPTVSAEEYLTLVNEVSEGLFFQPVTLSRDATTVLAALRQLKQAVTGHLQRVVGGEFNRNWQAPEWLREITNRESI